MLYNLNVYIIFAGGIEMAKKLEEYTLEEITGYINKNLDALIMIDGEADKYRAIVKKGFFTDFLEDTGSYSDLIQKLWININDGKDTITDDYKVFIPTYGKFSGKYSKRLKITENDNTHTSPTRRSPRSRTPTSSRCMST